MKNAPLGMLSFDAPERLIVPQTLGLLARVLYICGSGTLIIYLLWQYRTLHY